MHMRVQTKVLPPGMQYTNCSGFNPEISIPGSTDSIPRTSEQTVVKRCAVKHANIVKFVGYREYDMIVLNWQGRVYQFINPESLFGTLAFGAMAVTATVITDIDIPATITSIFMSPKFKSTALCNDIKGMQDICIRIVSLYILLAKVVDDLGQFKLWLCHR